MDGSKVSDYFGKKVTIWLLGQSQLSISPGLKTNGTLLGSDQSVYIIRLDPVEKSGKSEVVMIPMSQCRLSFPEE